MCADSPSPGVEKISFIDQPIGKGATMYGLQPADHNVVTVMTIPVAHRIMQEHIDCPITVCALKRQAKRALIGAGMLRPATAAHAGS
ncbi:hypothetical protein ABIA39_004178 [Nocardia sp. GAS34]|uniref:hypothetical protein n=1 Tax=Nocardia sp. GAS34 TaxID=3156305 RepID=UPI003D1BC64B